MSIVLARIAVFTACIALGIFIFWIGGGDLERGADLQLSVVGSLAFAAWIQAYPRWPSVTR